LCLLFGAHFDRFASISSVERKEGSGVGEQPVTGTTFSTTIALRYILFRSSFLFSLIPSIRVWNAFVFEERETGAFASGLGVDRNPCGALP
jgi:hypothetical protein